MPEHDKKLVVHSMRFEAGVNVQYALYVAVFTYII